MHIKIYKGKQVTVKRLYTVGDKTLVDVVELATGKKHTVEPGDFEQEPVKKTAFKHHKQEKRSGNITISFTKNGKEKILIKDSDEYINFVAQNKLNPVFINNCLKGVSKTHKGYTIKYKN